MLDGKYCYDGSHRFAVSKCSTNETSLCENREDAEEKMAKNNKLIDALQEKLYAEKREGVIFLFQAMDAAGKDGTIRAVLSCLSPHGVHEAAFKAPSANELAHDFLWRVVPCVPTKGEIAIFNRSHYEDVLIGKVKELYRSQQNARRINLDKVIEHRYEDIRNFEEYLYRNNVRTVKIFLNVSKNEQAKRFLSRIEEPEKNWKFSGSDYEERAYWDAYQEAFEDAINATSTKHCPWYVVPADHKWYMRYVVSEIILKTLTEMDPQYPEVTADRLATFARYREELLKALPEEYLAKIEKKKEKKKKKAEKAENGEARAELPES
jgi:PPK2 family polyphosphate:nucleotide phosphotransferase